MSTHFSKLNVAVIGGMIKMTVTLIEQGSIGGLSAAIELRKLGANVKIFERSSGNFESRGAGLGVDPSVVRHFIPQSRNFFHEPNIFLHLPRRHVVVQPNIEFKEGFGGYVTNYDLLYKTLRNQIPDDIYNISSPLSHFHDDESQKKVFITFEDGHTEECDLLVCADGSHSTAREQLFSKFKNSTSNNNSSSSSKPRYVGYVLWRGLLEEENLPHDLKEYFMDGSLHLIHAKQTQLVAYAVPGLGGNITPGKRRLNWGWYYNVAPDTYKDFMTDKDGVFRDYSIPPGFCNPKHVARMQQEALSVWPSPVAKLIQHTSSPFIQAIHEFMPKFLVQGRVCLIGDAAHVARPHTGAGARMAMEDSIELASTLSGSKEDNIQELIPSLLKEYERKRLRRVQAVVEMGQQIGDSQQFGRGSSFDSDEEDE